MSLSRDACDGVRRHRFGDVVFAFLLMCMMLLPAIAAPVPVGAQEDVASQATPIADPAQPDDEGGKNAADSGDDGEAFQTLADGFTITITPDNASVAPGASVTFTVTIAGTLSDPSGSGDLLTFETLWPFPDGVTSFDPGSSCDTTPAWDGEDDWISGWWWLDAYCYTDTTGYINATFSVTGGAPDSTGSYDIESTLYQGDYEEEITDLVHYSTLTIEGESGRGDSFAVTITRGNSTVAPGTMQTFTADIDVSMGVQSTVYVQILWPFTELPLATNAAPCVSSALNNQENPDYYWYDVVCTTDASGNLDYSFNITGRVPYAPTDYYLQTTMFENAWNDTVLLPTNPIAAIVHVDDSLTVPGEYSLSVSPVASTVTPGAAVSFDVQASGTLTDGGGTPVYPGTVYVQVAVPFYGNSTNIPAACTLDRQLAADPYAWFNLVCAVGPGGVFDYSFTITGTAPGTEDSYGIAAGLYENEWFGDHELIAGDTIANLTVDSTPPPTGDPMISIVQNPSGEVDPGAAVSYTVTYSGSIHSGGLSAMLTTTWPWPIPLDGTLSGNCASPSTGTDNETFWSLTIMCPGPIEGGPFSFSYTLGGTAPVEPGNYPIAAELTYYSDDAEEIDYDLDPPVILTVAGAGENDPDPYVVTVSPAMRDALPGEDVTYTVSFSGTLLDEDEPQPNHQIYLETVLPFDTITGNTLATDTSGGCEIGFSGYHDVHSWWFDADCTTDAEGDFSFTFTVTGAAPSDTGSYPVESTLYDFDPGIFPGSPVLASATYATLTVIEPAQGAYSISASPEELVVTPGGDASFDVSLSGTLIDGYGNPVADGKVALVTNWPFAPGVASPPSGCTATPIGFGQLETICDTDGAGDFDYTFAVTGTAPVSGGPSGISGQLLRDSASGTTLTDYRTLANLVVRGVNPNTALTIVPSLVAAGIGDMVPFVAQFTGVADQGAVMTLELSLSSFDYVSGSCSALTGSCTPPVAGGFGSVTSTVTADAETGAYDVTLAFAVIVPDWASPGYLQDVHVSAIDTEETVLATATGSVAVVSDEISDGLQITIEPVAVSGLPGSTHTFTVDISGDDVGTDTYSVGVLVPDELIDGVSDVTCATVTGSSTCILPTSEYAYPNGQRWTTEVTPDANGDVNVQMTFSVTIPASATEGDVFSLIAAPGPVASNFSVATLTVAIPGAASFIVSTGDAAPVPDDASICLSGNDLAEELCADVQTNGDPPEFADLTAGTYDYELRLPINSSYQAVSGSVTVEPEDTTLEAIVLQPGIAVTLALFAADVAPGGSVAMTATVTLQTTISDGEISLRVPSGFSVDAGNIVVTCATPQVCGTPAMAPAGDAVTIPVPSGSPGTISFVARLLVPGDAANGAYDLDATLTLPTARRFGSGLAIVTVDDSLLPPTIGAVQVMLSTSDGGDLPDGAEVCIGSSCEIVGEASGAGFEASATSPVRLTFEGVANGMQPVTVQGAAPYLDYLGEIGVVAGNTVTLDIVLLAPDAPPVNTPAPTPPVSTATPTPADGGTPTSTIPAGKPGDEHTPIATHPAGDAGHSITPAVSGPGVTQLPNTGAGSEGAGAWWLLVLGMLLLAIAGMLRWHQADSRRR